MIGSTISHYRVLEKLGEGGMGVVYRAEDVTLQRSAALKFLPSNATATAEARARFLREARAAAALQHPNICTVYEVNEFDGQPFIAMAYIDGVELASEVENGPLGVDRLIEIATQVAEGLQEAHEVGIVHRDVKPANIMLTPRGQVVLMDFGLAQLTSATSKITREGTTVGTSAYMSPEQTTGDSVDHRTDIWALGVVMYEMATGQLPFRGHYEQAVLYSILNEDPERISNLRADLPSRLVEVVDRSLSKRPEDRYQSAADLLSDLRSIGGGSDAVSTASRPPSVEERSKPSVAVMPFENRSRDEDDEYLSDGIAEDIIDALTGVDGLRVSPRSSVFRFKGSGAAVEEVAEKLRVAFVVEGTVRRAGQRIRITAQLIDVREGYQLWSERYDRVMEDIFDVQDEISRAMVGALSSRLLSGSDRLVRTATSDPEAYRLYLQGRRFVSSESGLRDRRKHLEAAIARDPQYAEAHAALADAFIYSSVFGLVPPTEGMEQARAEASLALKLFEDLAEAHMALGFVHEHYDWDPASAERSYKRAIELNPSSATVRYTYGTSLAGVGRFEEGIAQIRIGLEAEPLSARGNLGLAYVLGLADSPEAAIDQSVKCLEIDSRWNLANLHTANAHLASGRPQKALEAAQAGVDQAPEDPIMLGALGHAQAAAGFQSDARETVQTLLSLRPHRHNCALPLAEVLASLGETDEAFKWLEVALEERETLLCHIRFRRELTGLFDVDPRYDALLSRMGRAR